MGPFPSEGDPSIIPAKEWVRCQRHMTSIEVDSLEDSGVHFSSARSFSRVIEGKEMPLEVESNFLDVLFSLTSMSPLFPVHFGTATEPL